MAALKVRRYVLDRRILVTIGTCIFKCSLSRSSATLTEDLDALRPNARIILDLVGVDPRRDRYIVY